MTGQDTDLGKNLEARFPWLARTKVAWGWECDPGWEKIITDFLTVVDQECPNGKGFQILQVKEKLGTVRFYYRLDGVEEDTERRIRDAETLLDARSLHTCETCGKRGRMRNAGGYMFVACEDHAVVEGRKTRTYEPEGVFRFSGASGSGWYDPETDQIIQGEPPTRTEETRLVKASKAAKRLGAAQQQIAAESKMSSLPPNATEIEIMEEATRLQRDARDD